jgi:hypothetical protein
MKIYMFTTLKPTVTPRLAPLPAFVRRASTPTDRRERQTADLIAN